MKRAMVRSARRVVVLADSSKIGVESPVRFATIDQLDVVVTDERASTPSDKSRARTRRHRSDRGLTVKQLRRAPREERGAAAGQVVVVSSR